jgi:hypothetical protein
VTLTSFSSFSTERTVAETFAEHAETDETRVRVLFILRSSRRVRLGGFTSETHQHEEEVLLPPFSIVVVGRVGRLRGHYEVELVDLPEIDARQPLFLAVETGNVTTGRMAVKPELGGARDKSGRSVLLTAIRMR